MSVTTRRDSSAEEEDDVTDAPALARERGGGAVGPAGRRRITLGLLLAIFVAAIDGTVVSTAVPTIAGQLGHFALYPWLIAAYLLTSTTTVPLWGRLADLYGRRRVLMAGLGSFLAASLLCGSAPDMIWLIGFRALQGVGAGCLVPVALTAVGDLYTLEERARLQGVFTSVWAVAALVGPAVGALFLGTVGWRWIFWINGPVIVASALLVWTLRDAPAAGARGRLDYAGAVTLTAGIALVLVGLGGGGGSPLWLMVIAGVLVLMVFIAVQRRAVSPTIPPALLRHPVIGPATGVVFLAGILMFAGGAFLPLYVQGVLQGTTLAAGATVALSSLGWSTAAVVSGRVMLRFGYQPLVVTGAVCMVASCAALMVQPPPGGIAWVAASAFVMGLGMGQLQTPLLIVMQSAVDWSSRGATTALNQFARTIGGAVGVSLLGLVLRAGSHAAAAARGVDPARVADPLSRTGHLDSVTAPVVAGGLEAVFGALLFIAAATLAASAVILAVSRRRPA